MSDEKIIRLMDLSGELIAEAHLPTLVGNWTNPDALIFSNRVFLLAFTQARVEYFREVKVNQVRQIDVLSTSSFPKQETLDNG